MSLFAAQMLGAATGAGIRADQNAQIANENYKLVCELNDLVVKVAGERDAYATQLQEVINTANEHRETANAFAIAKAKYETYFRGMEAERDFAMDYIDQLLGGAENNPLRGLAYPDDPSKTVLAGPRKGQRYTYLERIGTVKMLEIWKARFQHISDTLAGFLTTRFEIK